MADDCSRSTAKVKNIISALCSGSWLVVIFFLCGCSPLSAAVTTKAVSPPVVAAMLQAYGGREALAAVRTVAARGRIDDDLRHLSGSYSRIMRRPAGLRIEIRPEQGGEVRILDGEQGWQGSGAHLEPAKEISLASMRYQYGYLDLPMCLADNSCTAEAGGVVKLDDRSFDLLLVTVPAAPLLRVYVDRDTHLIHRVATEFSMGALGSSELATEYADFQPAAGVLFPRLLTNFAGGGKISLLTIETLEVNQPLPASVFAVPGKRR